MDTEDFFNKLYAEEDELKQCAFVTNMFFEWCRTGRFDLCKDVLRNVNVKKIKPSVGRCFLTGSAQRPLNKLAIRKKLFGNLERHLIAEHGKEKAQEVLDGLK